MQCPGSLRRPLWDVVKSIGRTDKLLPRPYTTSTSTTRPRCSSAALARTTPGRHRHSSTTAPAQQNPPADDDGLPRPDNATTFEIRYPKSITPAINFAGVISDAAASRPRDGLRPRVKDTSQFTTRYFKGQYKRHELEGEKVGKAYLLQEQRDADLWKSIIRMLDDSTPSGKPHHQKRIETVRLPAGIQAKFKGHLGAAILEIMERTECHVQLGPEFSVEGLPNAFTGLILQGTASAVNETIDLLPTMVHVLKSQAAGEITTLDDYILHREWKQLEMAQSGNHLPLGESQKPTAELEANAQDPSSGPIRPRSVWSQNRLPLRPGREMLKETKPSSPVEFAAYIADLTASVPRLLSMQSSEDRETKDTTYVNIALQTLATLYSDPSLNKFATSEAVDMTFRCCTKYHQYSYLREVYKSLEESSYQFTSSNFGVLLDAAARKGDVHNFDYTLKVMQRKRLQPTAWIWASLHDLVRRRFSKQAGMLVNTMRKKGLFEDNRTVLGVLNNTIADDLMAHLANGGDIESFTKHYDHKLGMVFDRPGFNWLHVDILNRAANVLLTVGRTQDAFRILAEFKERSGEQAAANTTTLNVFLTQAQQDRDASAAVAALKHFHVGLPGALLPDHITYQILFLTAWNRRCYNMLRVIWRYACAAGHISHEMETRILESLMSYAPKTPSDGDKLVVRDVWRAWAGKFVIGVAQDLSTKRLPEFSRLTESSLAPPLSEFESRMVELACQSPFKRGTSESKARAQEMERRLKNDFDEVENCEPVRPFSQVLEEAWRLDVQWREEQLGSSKDFRGEETFTEMLRRGVKVDMQAGDFTRESRRWEVPWLLARVM